MTAPPFGLTPEHEGVTLLTGRLGEGRSFPAPSGAGLLVAVELDVAAGLDAADAPERLVTVADVRAGLEAAGWTVAAVRPGDGQTQGSTVALAHAGLGDAVAAVVASLEADRAEAAARADALAAELRRLGGQKASELAAAAAAAAAHAGETEAALEQERAVRAHLEETVERQAGEIARLVTETWTLKQRLVGPDGVVSPRTAAVLAQGRRVVRVVRRRLAARA